MMYKNNNAFTKKSFFSLFFILILAVWGTLHFTSCSHLFEDSIPSSQDNTDTGESPLPAGEAALPSSPAAGAESTVPQTIIVRGQLFISGAVPEEVPSNSENTQNSASDRAAVPTYVASEMEYFATATNGTYTVDGFFGSDDTATSFEIPLTAEDSWTITCGLKKISSGDILFSASTDDPVNPASIEGTVLQFFLTPDISGDAESTGEIDLSMTVASTITSYKISCTSSNSTLWPFSSDPITITGTTATIKTDSSIPSVRSGAYEVVFDFYKEGGVLAYSTVQTINVCKNLKTRKWIASGGLTPIESDGTFNVTAAKIASYVNTYIYVGTVEGGTPASDTNAGNHTAPFLTLSRALSYIEGVATAAGANTSLEYKIMITGEVDNTSDTTVPEIGSSLNGKAAKIIIKGRGTSPSIKNPNPDGRILTIGTTVPVEFYNLTIKDGNASGSDSEGKGGALYINTFAAKVYLTNCTIRDCSANSVGGGIFVSSSGAWATLTNCTIRDCHAGTLGGAVYVADGTSTAPATVFLYSCLIGGELTSCADSTPVANSGSNYASGGGGICIDSNGKAVLQKTKIIGNIAQYYGGGIRCVGGTLNISQGQINYNYSGASGGGLFMMGSATVTINNLCVIGKAISTSDSAATGLSDCGNYSASEGGGGIRIEGGALTTDSGFKVTKNYSAGTGANGGGISTKSAIILKKADISCNKTTGNGGGIYVDTGGGLSFNNGSTFYKSQINKNLAVNGGGIYTDDTNATIKVSEYTDIDGNEAACGAGIYSVAGAGNDSTGKLIISGGSSNITTSVVRNHASDTGGGVYNSGTAFIYGIPQIGFNNSGTGGNTAVTAGGGIYNTGNLYIGYSAWTDEVTNTVDADGGRIHYNVAPLGAGLYTTGAVYFAKGFIEYQTSTDNTSGAGVYIAGGSFTMNNTSRVIGNNAQGHGGGFYVDASSSDVSLTINSTGEQGSNLSIETGGFIYIKNGSATSASVTLKGNVKVPYQGSSGLAWTGKNDICLNNGLITVSESEPLTGTAVITLTPASYTMGQQLLTGTGIAANRAKFTLAQDSDHPNASWAVSTTGKLYQPVLKTSSYTSMANLCNDIKNDDDEIQVIIDSAISAVDLGASNTPNTIAYGIRHNNNANAKISLSISGGISIPLDTTTNANLFDSCSKLVYADLKGCNTSSVTDMSEWFIGCAYLEELILTGWNTSSVTNMASMFNACSRLETIYTSSYFITLPTGSYSNMFLGCSNLVGGQGTVYNPSYVDRTYAHQDGGTTNPGYFTSSQFGSKASGSTLEVGDIVFSDGSATPYTSDITFTERQKNNAIAIIFYKGTASDALGEKTLGVGLVHKESIKWADGNARGANRKISDIICTPSGSAGDYTFEGDIDGSDNLSQMASFLSTTYGTSYNDTATASNYPAFYFAINYKDEAGSNVSGTGYQTGWYLPSIAELFQIYKNGKGSSKVFDIDAASQTVNGSQFGATIYGSSSQVSNNVYFAFGYGFSTGVCTTYNKSTAENPKNACAIHEFQLFYIVFCEFCKAGQY